MFLVKYFLAKVIPDSKLVLGPSYEIFEIALDNEVASFVKSDINLASSAVPSFEISVLVEKLTTPIFNLVLSFKRLVIKVCAELISKSSLVFVSLTFSSILFELSITSITSPVGFEDSSLFFTCN